MSSCLQTDDHLQASIASFMNLNELVCLVSVWGSTPVASSRRQTGGRKEEWSHAFCSLYSEPTFLCFEWTSLLPSRHTASPVFTSQFLLNISCCVGATISLFFFFFFFLRLVPSEALDLCSYVTEQHAECNYFPQNILWYPSFIFELFQSSCMFIESFFSPSIKYSFAKKKKVWFAFSHKI